MKNDLNSSLWKDAMEKIRQCHLSAGGIGDATTLDWKDAFDSLVEAIKEERKSDPAFSAELMDLTQATEVTYDFSDILEEYFDHLEEEEDWQDVIDSCHEIISLFKWEKKMPSEYNFRIGNALNKMGRVDEAEAFGQEWLASYPQDLNAAAANVFLKVQLKKFDEAEEITEHYLRDDLLCDDETDTFFMAAYRLYELTDNIYAKQRVEKKMAEYNAMMEENK